VEFDASNPEAQRAVPDLFHTGDTVSLDPSILGGGVPTSFSVQPPLPKSLKLDPLSGKIRGTFDGKQEVPMQTHFVTASNAGGETQTEVTFEVKSATTAPKIAYEDFPKSLKPGETVAQAPTLLGGSPPTSFTMGPTNLPKGLSLDPTTGEITGAPEEAAPAEDYAVTASNSAGEDHATVTFIVTPNAPLSVAYDGEAEFYHPGESVAILSPMITGGAPTTYSVKPALPKGLKLDPATGAIEGTLKKKEEVGKETYVITAANGGGKASTEITFAVATPAAELHGEKKSYATGDKVKVVPEVSGFKATEYKVEPDLPKELALDKNTGEISGVLKNHKKPLPKYEETAFGIEGGAKKPEAHWTVKLPGPPAAFPWWIVVLLIVVIGVILYFCCKPEEPKTYQPLPQPEPEPKLVMLWDTPNGAVTTKSMNTNLGLRFCVGTAPVKISRDTGNLGDLGIQVGWGLKQVNDTDLRSQPNAQGVANVLKQQGVGTMEVVMTWGTSGADKTVFCDLDKKPLGIRFPAKFPLGVERDQDTTRDLGVQTGWTLKTINGSSITGITDYLEMNSKLKAEGIGLLEVPMTWGTGDGDKTVYAIRKPLGLKFPSELPLKISEENEGHGKEIGVLIGWELKNINGVDVSKMTDFKEVNDVLHANVKRI
jgi:hypothetical protein